jgi:hypothetical protein
VVSEDRFEISIPLSTPEVDYFEAFLSIHNGQIRLVWNDQHIARVADFEQNIKNGNIIGLTLGYDYRLTQEKYKPSRAFEPNTEAACICPGSHPVGMIHMYECPQRKVEFLQKYWEVVNSRETKMNKRELFEALDETRVMIDEQIDAISETAKKLGFKGEGISPSKMRDAQGSFVLIPLLLARAQVFAGMALLDEVLGDGEEEMAENDVVVGNPFNLGPNALRQNLPPEPKQESKIWIHSVTGDCIWSEESDNVMLSRNYLRPKGQTYYEDQYPSLFALYGARNAAPRRPFDSPRKFQMPKEEDLRIRTGDDD